MLTSLLSLTLKIRIPSDNIIGEDISPTGVFANLDLIFSDIIPSFTHPKSPPLIEDSEMLKFLATLSNPSIFILFFISSIFNSS